MPQFPTRCRFRAESAKLGSISQNRSNERANSIQHVSQIILFLFRFRSRDSSSVNGITQWKMKSQVQTTHHPPRMRLRYQGISSGTLPDQMIGYSANDR